MNKHYTQGIVDLIETRSRALASTAARWPRAVFIAWALLTVLPLPGLLRLESNTDGLALLPPGDAALEQDRRIRQEFDLRDQVVLLVEAEGPQGVLEPQVLAEIEAMTAQAAAIETVGRRHVLSLATASRDRLYPGSGETFGSYVEPLPRTAEEFDLLAADLDSAPARPLTGTVISSDRRSAAVLVGAPEGLRQRQALVAELESIALSTDRAGLRVSVVGAPAATAQLAHHILWDLTLLVPVSLLAIALLLWLGTRSRAAVLLALGKVGVCIAWTFGVLGLLGVPIYLPVTIVPVILAAMCIADEIHLLLRFQRELTEGGGRREALERTMYAMATPVVVATATTCIGFLSCLATGIPPIQALGAGAALGTAYSLFFSLMVTPALFATLPLPWFGRKAAVAPARREARLGLASRLALKHPATTLAVLGLVTAGALVGVGRMYIQDSWIDCFSPSSAFRQATGRANRALDGVHLLHVHLAIAGGQGTLLEPPILDRLERFGAVARSGPTVGGVVGPLEQLAAVAAFWKVPDWRVDGDRARQVVSRFDFAPGESRRRRVLNDRLNGTVLTLFLKDANFRDTAVLMDSLHEAHRELLAPYGIELGFAGDIAVSQALIPAVVRGQMISLPLALVGVFLSVLLLCGSLRLALAALLPVTLGALWLLGGLGWAGIPLGVATSMFFVISIGLGVDSHSIHLILRYRETKLRGETLPARVAAQEVRPAILVNSMAIATGFGLLALSSVPPNRNLGLLIAGAILLGCVITLTGLVTILAWVSDRRTPEKSAASLSKLQTSRS